MNSDIEEWKKQIYSQGMKKIKSSYAPKEYEVDPRCRYFEDLEDARDISGGKIEELEHKVFENYKQLTPKKINQIYKELSDIFNYYELKEEKENIILFLIFQMYGALMELENRNIAININCKEYVKVTGKLSPIRYIGQIYDENNRFKLDVEVFLIYNRGNKVKKMIEIYKRIRDLDIVMPWFSEAFEFENNKAFIIEKMENPEYQKIDRRQRLTILMNIICILRSLNKKGIVCDVRLTDIGVVNYEKKYFEYILRKFNMSILESQKDVKWQFEKLCERFEEEKLLSLISSYQGKFLADALITEIIKERRKEAYKLEK